RRPRPWPWPPAARWPRAVGRGHDGRRVATVATVAITAATGTATTAATTHKWPPPAIALAILVATATRHPWRRPAVAAGPLGGAGGARATEGEPRTGPVPARDAGQGSAGDTLSGGIFNWFGGWAAARVH